MKKRTSIPALAAILVVAGAACAQVPGEKTVDGVVVRIGIASAELVGRNQAIQRDGRMQHDRKESDRDHVVVSLSDATTGERFADAQVELRVNRAGVDHTRRALDAMPMPGAPSYGGWIDLRQPGPYRLTLEIRRHAGAPPSLVQFELNDR